MRKAVTAFILSSSLCALTLAETGDLKHWRDIPGCTGNKPDFACVQKAFRPLKTGQWPFDASKVANAVDHFGPYLSPEFQLVTLHRTPGPRLGLPDPFLPDFKYEESPFPLPGTGVFLFAGGHPHAMECKAKGTPIHVCVNEVPIEERFDIGLRKTKVNPEFLPYAKDELKFGDEVYLIHSPFLPWLSPEEQTQYQANLPVVSVGTIRVVFPNLIIVDNLGFQGSSGGTLVNKAGEVIGVASARLTIVAEDKYFLGVMILNPKMKAVIQKLNP